VQIILKRLQNCNLISTTFNSWVTKIKGIRFENKRMKVKREKLNMERS